LKFMTDGMLGKMTRWLRMMGHDVEYSTTMSDGDLLVVAKDEKRILLTRDLELYKQAIVKGLEAFYVGGQSEAERLADLSKRFGIDLNIDMSSSRCPKCNTPVHPTSKNKIAGKLEKNTLEHYSEFWNCRICGQVYWQGAHWTRIRETFADAEEILKGKTKNKERV
jgi:uncharacterized protein with PIN domain